MSRSRRIYVYGMALVAGWILLIALLVTSRRAFVEWSAGRLRPLDAGMLELSPLMPWLWIGLAAGVLWLFHWLLAQQAAKSDTEAGLADRASAARKAYLYAMQFAALVACLLQGEQSAGDGIARFLRQPPERLTPWPANVLAAAASLVIGLVFWAYHRRVTLADGDFGREAGSAASWRRAYFYVMTATGVALMLLGTVELLRAGLGLGGDLILSTLPGAPTWRNVVAHALTLLVVGTPLAVLAWNGANQPVRAAPEREINALSRVLFLRGGAFLSTAAALVSLGYVLRQVFLVAFGLRIGQVEALWTTRLVTMVALAPVAVAAWVAFAGALQNDAVRGGEGARAARLRRLHFYFISSVSLVALWYGLTQLLQVILPLALDALSALEAGLSVSADRLSLAAALVLVGAPAWWGHWWPQQVRARQFTADGAVERVSALRRLYLYVVIGAATLLVLISLGLMIYALAGGTLRRAAPVGTVVLVSGALATGLVALTVWLVHVMAMRADRLTQLAWVNVQPALAAKVPSSSARPEGSRTLQRETLATLATAAAAATLANNPPPPIVASDGSPPIVVIDSGDGALGAPIVAGLHAALPKALIWPVGLTPAAQAAMVAALLVPDPPIVPPDAVARAALVIAPSDFWLAPVREADIPMELAPSLAASGARILLLPPRNVRFRWVAAPDWPLERWVQYAVSETTTHMKTLS